MFCWCSAATMATMENSKTKKRLVVRIGTTPYSPPPAPGEIVVGELEIDVPEQRVEENGKPTPKPYDRDSPTPTVEPRSRPDDH